MIKEGIYTYKELAEKLDISKNSLNLYFSRAEFEKFRTIKNKQLAIIFNEESFNKIKKILKAKDKNVLTVLELSKKINVSNTTIFSYFCRPELSKDIVPLFNKKRIGIKCTKKNMLIFYNLIKNKYLKNFNKNAFFKFYNTLEEE